MSFYEKIIERRELKKKIESLISINNDIMKTMLKYSSMNYSQLDEYRKSYANFENTKKRVLEHEAISANLNNEVTEIQRKISEINGFLSDLKSLPHPES